MSRVLELKVLKLSKRIRLEEEVETAAQANCLA
jgi:hypothetical protein